MVNLTNHTTENRRILFLYYMIHLSQAKRIECSLLIDRSTDSTLYLFDLYCCHSR